MHCFLMWQVIFPRCRDLFWQSFIGAAVAAVFGVIIGIPVLRLRGDYLAIVTLAFGEIIKNLINILYVGFDENGLHVATKCCKILIWQRDGKQILEGCTWYRRYRCTL